MVCSDFGAHGNNIYDCFYTDYILKNTPFVNKLPSNFHDLFSWDSDKII